VLLCIGVMMLAQDMPDGNIADLYSDGALKKPGGASVWRAAVFNYRTWVMALTYGYAFGVELTVDNVISQYLFDQVGGCVARGLPGCLLSWGGVCGLVVVQALFQTGSEASPLSLSPTSWHRSSTSTHF